MFQGKQLVHWLDVNSQEAMLNTISKLAGVYSHKIVVKDDERITLSFDAGLSDTSSSVKITDWKGWSAIQSVTIYNQQQCSDTEWIVVTTEHGKTITGSPDAMLPIYDDRVIVKGFHGESKYLHRIARMDQLRVGNTLRVLHLQNDAGDLFDFDDIASIETIAASDHNNWSGYEIITRSGYVNIGDVYAFAGHDEQAIELNKEYIAGKKRLFMCEHTCEQQCDDNRCITVDRLFSQ